jgi:hypothetical protein
MQNIKIVAYFTSTKLLNFHFTSPDGHRAQNTESLQCKISQLTPLTRVPNKLTVTQLAKKLPTFMEPDISYYDHKNLSSLQPHNLSS